MTATRGRTAAFTLALSLITGAITARQQPQPAPAPTPTIDLSGKWVTDEGFIVHIEQHGSSVNARFEQSHPCKSGGERTSLLVDARYGGSTLSGTRAYIACAFATPPFLRVCNLESVYGTKFEATVSADGSMISGQWLADGHWVTLSGDTPVGCRPDSTYDALTDFTLTRCGSIAINLTSPDNFKINTDPKMAEVKAASDPAQSGATWESKITFSRSAQTCSGGPDFNSTNVTGTGADFTPAFGALYGGDVKFVLKSACGDVTVNKEILGTDPSGRSQAHRVSGERSTAIPRLGPAQHRRHRRLRDHADLLSANYSRSLGLEAQHLERAGDARGDVGVFGSDVRLLASRHASAE
jgi:hypothetical protein